MARGKGPLNIVRDNARKCARRRRTSCSPPQSGKGFDYNSMHETRWAQGAPPFRSEPYYYSSHMPISQIHDTQAYKCTRRSKRKEPTLGAKYNQCSHLEGTWDLATLTLVRI